MEIIMTIVEAIFVLGIFIIFGRIAILYFGSIITVEFIDTLLNFWNSLKKWAKNTWKVIQIIIVLVIIFLFYFGIPILDKCTSKDRYYDDEEIENIENDIPPRGVPSRYW